MASTASEIIESVKERIYERSKSPFVGAFVIAWVIINFRVIYALHTAKGYTDAFQIIDTKIWVGFVGAAFYGLLLPVLSVFVYMTIVPILEEWAVLLWANGKLKVRSARLKVEDGAVADGAIIKDYEAQIEKINQQNISATQQIRKDHSTELSELKQRLENHRDKACDSLVPDYNSKKLLQNMSAFGRDILWISHHLGKDRGELVNTSNVLNALRQFHPDFPQRVFSEYVIFLSRECYIKQAITEVIADTSFSLSVRGIELVKVMRTEELEPKMQGRQLNEFLS